jgi:uncharacterized lipoprotein YddW (UPF0748 family)
VRRKEYTAWRCRQISTFVQGIRAAVKDIDPNVQVSAAVFGKYPSCVESVAQDWGQWLRAGYVDFVCPMNYTTNLVAFQQFTRAQLRMPGGASKVYPGIGVTAAESRLTPLQVIDQIGSLRQAGARGFALYSLNRILEDETLPVLRLGILERKPSPNPVSPPVAH